MIECFIITEIYDNYRKIIMCYYVNTTIMYVHLDRKYTQTENWILYKYVRKFTKFLFLLLESL